MTRVISVRQGFGQTFRTVKAPSRRDLHRLLARNDALFDGLFTLGATKSITRCDVLQNIDQPTLLPPIYMIEDEYESLSDIICRSPRVTPGLSLLWQELHRAKVVSGREAPEDLVCMNSIDHFIGEASGAHRAAKLIYPTRERLRCASVCVATPVGAALIGLRAGSEFCWRADDSRQHIVRVERVEQGTSRVERLKAEQRQVLKTLLSESYGHD